MDPNLLIMLLLFGGAQEHTADIVKRTLPVALPGPAGQRFALAAFVADKELKRQDEEDKQIIQEVINADSITDEAALKAKSETLHAVFTRLPASVQQSIAFFREKPAEGSRKSQ